MREIKFRVWNNGKMRYGVEMSEDFPYMVAPQGEYVNCELMQYTGLKDKDGNEIYEDDIVENYDFINAPFRLGIITYENDLGCWKIKSLDTQEVILVYLDFISSKRCKVIGNRWANPELLPEEE